jgi:hypothetical protein
LQHQSNVEEAPLPESGKSLLDSGNIHDMTRRTTRPPPSR